jgi:aminoglycoside phosphotransferase (APT) family kinase protein
VPDSRTKTRLSPRQIGDLTREAFDGLGARSVGELTEGYFNSAYRVELEDDRRLILKVAPPADASILTYEHDLMRGEVEAMRLAASDPRVPVPVVRKADFSRERLPVDYFFMDLVEGRSWGVVRERLTPAQNADIERQLGVITAALNGLGHPTFGYLATGPAFGSWLEAFAWMCATLFADARRFGIEPPVPEREFERLLARHRESFAEVRHPRLVHWDLWAGNVLTQLDAAGVASVSGVIDFERALWADPLMEFIPGRLRGIEAYEAGYGRPLLSTREARIRRLFYNAYLGLVLMVEDGPRQYQDKQTVEWGRGLFERAVTMIRHGDVIERLLTYA